METALGHTGRPLSATRAVQTVYALVVLSVLARICASLHPAWAAAMLQVAGLAWAAAFLGFALAYWRVFTRPRIGRQG